MFLLMLLSNVFASEQRADDVRFRARGTETLRNPEQRADDVLFRVLGDITASRDTPPTQADFELIEQALNVLENRSFPTENNRENSSGISSEAIEVLRDAFERYRLFWVGVGFVPRT